MFRRLFRTVFLLLIVFLFWLSTSFAASSSDESVLGNDRWAVNSSGNIVPIANNSYTIGASSYRPSTIYGITGTFSGALTYHSNLLVTGVANGGGTSMTTTDIAVPLTYAYVKKAISGAADGATTGTLANGYPGQVLTIFITAVYSGGTWTLTPTTAYNFTSLTFTAAKDTVTLVYLSDSQGWAYQDLEGSITVTGIK